MASEEPYTKTLCFAILDDCHPFIEEHFTYTTRTELEKIIEECVKKIPKSYGLYWEVSDIPKLAQRIEGEWSVSWNWIDKYYCVCFAINYSECEVWSKGCGDEESPTTFRWKKQYT